MNMTDNLILTIGHSTHALDEFVALLRQHRVTAVGDVRSAPYSRFNPQFNRDVLPSSLKGFGIEYVYLGHALGGRSDDPACYEKGRICYDRVAKTEHFRHGLNRVVYGAANHRIALMCAEKEPLECHRTLLVSQALDNQGVKVAHIHADGGLESHADAMDRLLDLRKLPREDLFRTRKELIVEAIARQEEQVAFVDENLSTNSEGSIL